MAALSFEGRLDAIASEPAPMSKPKATAVAHAWLFDVTYKRLEAEAARRRVHVDALAAEIITAALLTRAVDQLILDAEKLLDR